MGKDYYGFTNRWVYEPIIRNRKALKLIEKRDRKRKNIFNADYHFNYNYKLS